MESTPDFWSTPPKQTGKLWSFPPTLYPLPPRGRQACIALCSSLLLVCVSSSFHRLSFLPVLSTRGSALLWGQSFPVSVDSTKSEVGERIFSEEEGEVESERCSTLWKEIPNPSHQTSPLSCMYFIIFNLSLNLLIIEREKGEREKQQFVVLPIHTSIGWFLYAPWGGTEPLTWHLGMTFQPPELWDWTWQ